MSVIKNLSPDGKHLRISIQGRFDFSLYKDFRNAYNDDCDSITEYTINLSATEYLDSSALGMLLVLKEQAGDSGSNISIVGANEELMKILCIANFDKMFNIK